MRSTRRSASLQTGPIEPPPKKPKTFIEANPLLPNLNLKLPSPSAPSQSLSIQPSPSLTLLPKPPRRKQVARKNTHRSCKPLNKLYSSSSSSDTDDAIPPPHEPPEISKIPPPYVGSPPAPALATNPPVPLASPVTPPMPHYPQQTSHSSSLCPRLTLSSPSQISNAFHHSTLSHSAFLLCPSSCSVITNPYCCSLSPL